MVGMVVRPSLRDRHMDRTRAALTEAALHLFRERGFSNTTVEAIAARADVARRTFFRYFRSKEAVLFYGMEQQIRLLRVYLVERPANEAPHVALITAMIAAVQELSADRDTALLIRRLLREEPALAALQRSALLDTVGEEIATDLAARSGLGAPSLTIRAQVASLIVCVATAFLDWTEAGAEGSMLPYVEEAIRGAAILFSSGLSRTEAT